MFKLECAAQMTDGHFAVEDNEIFIIFRLSPKREHKQSRERLSSALSRLYYTSVTLVFMCCHI